jgi:hypothetical protein
MIVKKEAGRRPVCCMAQRLSEAPTRGSATRLELIGAFLLAAAMLGSVGMMLWALIDLNVVRPGP